MEKSGSATVSLKPTWRVDLGNVHKAVPNYDQTPSLPKGPSVHQKEGKEWQRGKQF